eukprot:6450555-Pyramimonas_sp.AAC.1
MLLCRSDPCPLKWARTYSGSNAPTGHDLVQWSRSYYPFPTVQEMYARFEPGSVEYKANS